MQRSKNQLAILNPDARNHALCHVQSIAETWRRYFHMPTKSNMRTCRGCLFDPNSRSKHWHKEWCIGHGPSGAQQISALSACGADESHLLPRCFCGIEPARWSERCATASLHRMSRTRISRTNGGCIFNLAEERCKGFCHISAAIVF
jgi:hypothetical protein